MKIYMYIRFSLKKTYDCSFMKNKDLHTRGQCLLHKLSKCSRLYFGAQTAVPSEYFRSVAFAEVHVGMICKNNGDRKLNRK